MGPIPREIKICELFDAERLLLRSPERGEPDWPREWLHSQFDRLTALGDRLNDSRRAKAERNDNYSKF